MGNVTCAPLFYFGTVFGSRRAVVKDEVEQLIEEVLDRLGFELVDLERAGHRVRPVIRLRIDKPGSEPGRGVTVDDCALASRELEAELDRRDDLLPETYILEVSSPGVERPIRKRSDFERFVGHEVMLSGFKPLATGSRRVEGTLLGIEGPDEGSEVKLRLEGGDEITVPRADIAKAHLVYRWEETE